MVAISLYLARAGMFLSKQASKNSQKSRDEVVEKARLEREARLNEKKKNSSAVTIQACIARGKGSSSLLFL